MTVEQLTGLVFALAVAEVSLKSFHSSCNENLIKEIHPQRQSSTSAAAGKTLADDCTPFIPLRTKPFRFGCWGGGGGVGADSPDNVRLR